MVVTSTTNVANLNASSLGGATFAAPGAIGGGTASAITGTTIAGTDATDASSTTAAALKTAGGLAVVKKIYVGDNIVPAAAKGVNFTANTPQAGMTSQLLNWYEEGTFTPAVVGTTSAGTGSYAAQTGKYIRIGKSIHFTIFVFVTAHTGTGNMNISGLPFSADSANAAVTLAQIDSIPLTAGNILTAYVGSGTTINLRQSPIGAGGSPVAVPLSTYMALILTGTYFL